VRLREEKRLGSQMDDMVIKVIVEFRTLLRAKGMLLIITWRKQP
jgi:hypothetical protein